VVVVWSLGSGKLGDDGGVRKLDNFDSHNGGGAVLLNGTRGPLKSQSRTVPSLFALS
jgi:hypothetical protein